MAARGSWAVVVAFAVAACGSSGNAPAPGYEAGVAAADGGHERGDATDGGDVSDGGAAYADAIQISVDAGEICDDFTMPNPASAGLPNPASYVDNGDGTVTDAVTGLTWEGTVGALGYTQQDAAAYCAGKGAGWRLPTRLELLSLVDFTVAAPGPTINAVFKSTPSAVFWTSSLYAGNFGDAWGIGFDVGYSDYGVRNNPDSVRCVRPPAPRCNPTRLVAQSGGQVLDHATGLTWQQNLDPGSYTWNAAQTYCGGVGAGWRVPSLTELQTIINDSKEYPAIDLNVFPGTPAVDFWTSSPGADGSGSGWYVDFFYGASDRDVTARLFRVRCVR